MAQTPIRKIDKPAVYAVLVLIFALCVWVGWSDFNFQVPQEEVRAGIQTTIRQFIQVTIQFLVPAAILIYFAKEILRRFR